MTTRSQYFASLALIAALGCADDGTSAALEDASADDAGHSKSTDYVVGSDGGSDAGASVTYVAALTPLWGAMGQCNGCHYAPIQTFDGKPDMQGFQELVGKGPRDGLPLTSTADPKAACGEREFVVPGKPEQSYLIDKLLGHAQIKGNCFAGKRMPPDCEASHSCPTEAHVQAVADWIRAGAKYP